jgi:hypothetical protein
MDIPSSERERQRLAELYGSMSDAELQNLAQDAASLTEAALQALSQEADRRGLDISLAESTVSREIVEQKKLVVIRQFRDMPEALLAKGLLESAGIECSMVDDNLVRLDWFISNGIGGIKLAVKPEDANTAVEILDQPIPDAFEVEQAGTYEQPRCPRCGSTDISHEGQIDKRFALPALFLAGIPVPLPRDVWRCAACSAQWREVPDGPAPNGAEE